MYYLITGHLSTGGRPPNYVREIAKQTDENDAVLEVERRLAPGRTVEWEDEGPYVTPLPADMFMRYVARAVELPGLVPNLDAGE